ncbi:MAG: tetratricopeptide repeat protein [Erythrobacter sp.]|jgi:cytochrome c-type biogenesis protein CcmH|nr:tetratricopeptide repeat protein [Erythrobacter sp.]
MTTDTSGKPAAGTGAKAAWVLLALAAILAAGSIGYNIWSGSRGEEPEASAAPGGPTIEELRELAEASTDDARPWANLAFAYFERGEFADAAGAYERAVAIDPSEAVLWSALGEALVFASDAASANADPLPPRAIEAFEKAVSLDPTDPRARYFLNVKKDLAGDHEGAIAGWLELLSESPVGAPWETDLVRTIEQVGKIHDIPVEERLARAMEGRLPPVAGTGALAGAGAGAGGAGAGGADGLRGPTQEQIAAASQMSPEDQQAQIRAMVASAEAKLQDDPGNLDRWVMVMRSHSMLGDGARAKATLAAAIAANPEERAELERQAQALGIQ